MSRPFAAFLVQIKRNLRGTIAVVRDKKEFFARFPLEIVTKVFQGKRRAPPTAHAIGRIAASNFNAGGAQDVAIQRQRAHENAEGEARPGEGSPDRISLQMRLPKSDGQ